MKERIVLILATLSLIGSGCALNTNVITKDPCGYEVSRTFGSDFDTTWRSIIKAIEWYPIITIEKESGILVTDWVYGQSPNIIKETTFGGHTAQYGIGVLLMKTEADVLRVIDVLEGGPAGKAGLRKGDVILDVNQARVSSTQDFNEQIRIKVESVIRVNRAGSKEPITFKIKPQTYAGDKSFTPVEAMYRLNIRVSSLKDNQTEVKIINHEKADFGYFSEHGWIANYVPVETATCREKEILDQIQDELQQNGSGRNADEGRR